MKKHVWTVVLVFALIIGLRAQGPPPQQPMKPEEVRKALCLVDKTQPAPEKFKAGLEAITPKETIAMLTYIASDLLEGRETGTRGYALAAEYAASLFKLWGIKPAGDMPMMTGFRMGGGRGPAPQQPRERTYFQEFALKEVSDSQTAITVEVAKGGAVKSRTFQGGLDFMAGMGGMGGASEGSLTAPVVFLGYGISEPSIGFDELKGMNLKGKIVLLLSEAPGRDDPKSPLQAKKELKDKYFPAMPQGDMMAMMMRGGPRFFNKLEAIAKLEPAAILQVANAGTDAAIFNSLSYVRKPSDDQPIVNKPRRRLSLAGVSGGMDMGRFGASATTITREMANLVLEGTGQTIDGLKKKIESTMKPASMDVPGAKVTIATTAKTALVRGANVLGIIEGSDPKLKDEYFVVGAHYDHNGAWEGYIWNGADDNGSGSVGVLNIAKAIAASPVKPKRSIVFALWTGEEEGLLGSRYYAQNPVYPIDKTVGYLNYDMISRPYDAESLARTAKMLNVEGVEELVKKVRAPWFVSVNLTEGTPFADIAREMNQYIGLDLYFRFNALGQGGGGSDHSSFAAVKVPYVYYMAGMPPDYHQPSDSVEKVSGELIAKISQHGFLTVYAFADR
ncbi:MAG TPA: M20/M25/M40 family metallo-hydrolase [Candidatus Aminicenantes bacterium]|nr:M20/M25/M40 family metallo-hydrolase [Candidatus Aminicenantes bacterium]HRY65881.1 M20/M25/M40 family metallo-hydrolase [Candidatus Aminicenantes bacterium]HRZ72793.1 M20/M25/M40 family metallo-hydrolase [Candidatus Aminicenantes bacterium]